MTSSWFFKSFEAVEMIENQEKMSLFDVSSFPNLKNENRIKLHRETYKKGWPSTFRVKKSVSLSDVAKKLGINNGE